MARDLETFGYLGGAKSGRNRNLLHAVVLALCGNPKRTNSAAGLRPVLLLLCGVLRDFRRCSHYALRARPAADRRNAESRIAIRCRRLRNIVRLGRVYAR